MHIIPSNSPPQSSPRCLAAIVADQRWIIVPVNLQAERLFGHLPIVVLIISDAHPDVPSCRSCDMHKRHCRARESRLNSRIRFPEMTDS
jgi:hypothetical protein